MEIGSSANDAAKEDNSLSALWELDGSEYECDCPGPPPPPQFRLPPPPRPPFLAKVPGCPDKNIAENESCDVMTVIDAGYHGNPNISTLTLLVVCSALLLAGAFVIFALAWKHKKKVQNFLPCKSSPQNRCDVTHANGVIYEDLANVRPRTIQPPSSIEMLDVKSHHNRYVISHSPVFICSSTGRADSQYCPPPRQDHRYCSQDLYNPVYEELSNGSVDRGESDAESECCVQELTRSDDEFAEDELSLGEHHHLPAGRAHSGASSLQGSTGNDLCRDVDSSDADDRSRFLCHRGPCLRAQNVRNLSLPPNRRNRNQTTPKTYQNRSQQSLPEQKSRPRSLDRRRGGGNKNNGSGGGSVVTWRNTTKCGGATVIPDNGNEFHEGLLFDALFQMYPNHPNHGSGNVHQDSGHHVPPRLPYILPINAQSMNPYESVPVLNQLRQHNHQQQPMSQQLLHYHQQPQPPQFVHHLRHPQQHAGGQLPPQYYPSAAAAVVRSSQENFANVFRQPPSNGNGGGNGGGGCTKPTSQDSDSGYSNNTSGGRGSSSSRSKSETLQRGSTHGELPLS